MKAVPLGNVVSYIRGITFTPEDKVDVGSPGSVVCMRTKNIQDELDESDLIAVPAAFVRRKEQCLMAGDILISSANSWELVGKAVKVKKLGYEATAGGFISIVRANLDVIDPDYLYRWITLGATQHKIRHLGRQTTNISNLPVDQFLDLEIPLPRDIQEQQRIAAILDKADAIRRKRQQAIQLADEFLRSVFLDIFGDPITNPKRWNTTSLLNVTKKIGSGATPRGGKESYVESGMSLIRSLNVHDDKFLYKDLAHITDRQAEDLSNVAVEAGDVLLNITGASVCRCAMVPNDVLPARVNQHVCIIRPDIKQLTSEYLLHTIISGTFKTRLLALAGAGGATREALTKQQIENLTIPIPPVNDQLRFQKIKRHVSSMLGKIDAHASLPLFDSLSQRAFRGEL